MADVIPWLAWCYQALFFSLLLPLLFGLGIYLTLRLRMLQIGRLPAAFSTLMEKRSTAGRGLSHYEAVAAVLAGNFGTGNISGMAVALSTGGVGALFWMWVAVFCGSIIQYASCLLGARYAEDNHRKERVGGPMYYLRAAGYPKLAILFALATLLSAVTVGNLVQVNSLLLPFADVGLQAVPLCLLLVAAVAVVLLGGVSRFAKLASALVPLMALLYLGCAFWVLYQFCSEIPQAFSQALQAAFHWQAVVGGGAGALLYQVIVVGASRAILATDSGSGLAPLLQSQVRSDSPVLNGLAALCPPLIVMAVCTVTALVLMVTGAWNLPGVESTNLCILAFVKGTHSSFGHYAVLLSLLAFGYTTILAWAYCAERALEYLWSSEKAVYFFRFFYTLLLPVGAWMQVDLVWTMADLSLAIMTFVNLVGLCLLRKEVVAATRSFFTPAMAYASSPLLAKGQPLSSSG